tara:strand:- start:1582 stop:2820 length:1239 start_codon:yes stop_codon:yes gene_type:complete
MKRDFYTTPKSNLLMRFLWSCAGADPYVLERSTYTDHVKYACLGGIVLATGFMAAMAGGYAFYIIFEPRGEAISTALDGATHLPTTIMATIFGIIWGLIIFNIDRFIVASTGKGDGTEAITWSEMKGAIPRILMGMIIAITISKPVEIRMFQTEINVKLQENQQDLFIKTQQKAEKTFRPAIDEYQGRIAECKQEIADVKEEHRIAELAFQKEMDGEGGTGNRGIGPISAQKKILADRKLLELNDIQSIKGEEIDKLKIELLAADKKLKDAKSKSEQTANNLNGLLERIRIVHDIAGIWITLFITLLFMAIELTPIFFKMMLIKSPYDFMSDNIKSLLKAEQGIEVKYGFYKDNEGVQRDLVINHQADRLIKEKIKLLQTQNELSEVVMENWKIKETKNIKANPESYIDKKS